MLLAGPQGAALLCWFWFVAGEVEWRDWSVAEHSEWSLTRYAADPVRRLG